MKGSEYIAARAAITVAGLIVGGGVVAGTALFVVPWVVLGLEALLPGVIPPIGGLVVGLFVVVATAVLMRQCLGYILATFEVWVITRGGIED